MQPVAHLVKVSLPNYLCNLPIPDSFGGWFRLGFKDWLALIPPAAAVAAFTYVSILVFCPWLAFIPPSWIPLAAAVAGLTYISYLAFCPKARCPPRGSINPKILKNIDKVVDLVDIEDISDKAVFCRCWRTKNWPYCDGSHAAHNKDTGDNVGPLIVKHK